MPRDALRGLWADLFGKPPPDALRKGLLVSGIAWAIQVESQGDVSPAIRRDLTVVAGRLDLAKGAGENTEGPPDTVKLPPPASGQLTPGTRLVKLYGGETHVVEVTATGFLHKGQEHRSLSAIAKHITGTHWNGLLFFGLRTRKVKKDG